MAEKLSVVIITLNEEKNIGRCLEAASQVADEIVVVDSYSTDSTRQICEAWGAKFYQHRFEGYIEQKTYALSKASHPLILSIDADEVLSTKLISNIRQVKQDPRHDAYQLNRMSYYVNRFIRHGHWFPDKKVRLFKKGVGRWGGRNPHDQYLLPKGTTAPLLDGVLYHYTFNSISEHARQANTFSEIGARELEEQPLLFLLFKALFSPLWGFFYGYIGKLGFLDGWYGLVIAMISSHETFLKYAKAITYRYAARRPAEVPEQLPSTSLIISTYNWPQALRLSLESIKRQYLLPNEVIIADDGSTWETRQLIEEYQKDFPVPLHHCWIEDKGFRLAKSRNEALKKARYEYILQIDGDIILHKYFVYDHARFARPGTFVRGSRVLLNAKASERLFNFEADEPSIWMKGTTNFFNGLRVPLLQPFLTSKKRSIEGIRGCNMAYWKKDAFRVNGYNEAIQGWGREDSEFAARLINIGLYKRNLRLGGIEFHLYHKEYDRKLLNKNDDILHRAISEKLTQCEEGLVNLKEHSSEILEFE